MKMLTAFAVTLALMFVAGPAGAAHHGARSAETARIIHLRHAVAQPRARAWHYQDARHVARTPSLYLERNTHAVHKLYRLYHWWWRASVRERKAWKRYEAEQARRAAATNGPFAIDSCTRTLLGREGGMNPHAQNTQGSGAYGGPQALPGSKMASAGADWADNIWTQIRWMIGYMNSKYGGSCNALAHSYSYGWY